MRAVVQCLFGHGALKQPAIDKDLPLIGIRPETRPGDGMRGTMECQARMWHLAFLSGSGRWPFRANAGFIATSFERDAKKSTPISRRIHTRSGKRDHDGYA